MDKYSNKKVVVQRRQGNINIGSGRDNQWNCLQKNKYDQMHKLKGDFWVNYSLNNN